ncbi:MAG: NAD(P)-dependent oxidoreductase [Burkholderiaceae bacterium]
MAKLLVAGATGLIGSALLRTALQEGHDVTVMSRSSTDSGMVHERLRIVTADLLVPDRLWEVLPRVHFDAVVYLAQGDDHNSFPSNSRAAVALNVAAPLALCQWAAEMQCGRFVYASSGGVCGARSDAESCVTEDFKPLSTDRLSFYLATKARCEDLLEAFQSHVPITILRYFFVYGPQQRAHFLFPRMAARIRASEPIVLASGIGPRFNPIYVQDAARLTLNAMLAAHDGILNIAGPKQTCLAELVEEIARCLHLPSRTQTNAEVAPNFMASTVLADRIVGAARILPAQGMRETFESAGVAV